MAPPRGSSGLGRPTALQTAIGVAVLLCALAGVGAAIMRPEQWPLGLLGLIFAAGVVFERNRYRGDAAGAPPPPWVESGERFIDPQSKRLVRVWTHPDTGARRYVDDGARVLPDG